MAGVHYLHGDAHPALLHFAESGGGSRALLVWGSGSSLDKASLGATRAVPSGNASFQVDDAAFGANTRHVERADVVVCHSPPEGMLLGKSGHALGTINALLARVGPKAFICGHMHNSPSTPQQDRVAWLPHGVGMNACVTSTWNSLYGCPIVIDI